jgi:hypothetical protein
MIIKQLARIENMKVNDNHRKAIFQFVFSEKTICIFVITSTDCFTCLSGNSFTVKSESSAANKRLLSIVSHISYYFARGVNLFHLLCYDLW